MDVPDRTAAAISRSHVSIRISLGARPLLPSAEVRPLHGRGRSGLPGDSARVWGGSGAPAGGDPGDEGPGLAGPPLLGDPSIARARVSRCSSSSSNTISPSSILRWM